MAASCTGPGAGAVAALRAAAAILALGLRTGPASAEAAFECSDKSSCGFDEAEIDDEVYDVRLVQVGLELGQLRQQAALGAAEDTQASAPQVGLELGQLRQQAALGAAEDTQANSSDQLPPLDGSYGMAGCPCIGISRNGQMMVSSNGTASSVSADFGTSCKAWDGASDPTCQESSAPAWCSQSWCFVDPCNCNLTGEEVPRVSSRIPGTTFQGKQLYYSYSTCGEADKYTAAMNPTACVNQMTKVACDTMPDKCSYSDEIGCVGKEILSDEFCNLPNSDIIGDAACRCIGFVGLNGTTSAVIDGQAVSFPADVGAECQAWDQGRHPSCTGLVDPVWCKAKWCYVDPCNCNIDVVPKKNIYFPKATFQGRPLFYSYRTCGNIDTYTEMENPNACPTNPSEYQCGRNENCVWLPSKGCVHQDILQVCEAWGVTPFPHAGACAAALPPALVAWLMAAALLLAALGA